MLTITFMQAREAEACAEGYGTVRRMLPEVGQEDPIPIWQIGEILDNHRDVLWCLDAIGSYETLHMIGCDIAEEVFRRLDSKLGKKSHVQPAMREALRLSRLHMMGLAQPEQLWRLRDKIKEGNWISFMSRGLLAVEGDEFAYDVADSVTEYAVDVLREYLKDYSGDELVWSVINRHVGKPS